MPVLFWLMIIDTSIKIIIELVYQKCMKGNGTDMIFTGLITYKFNH